MTTESVSFPFFLSVGGRLDEALTHYWPRV
jgi:hypothetical protein